MCGRYALGIGAAFVRHQLQQQGVPVDNAPNDEDVRETYNFPPGSFGLVYRAETPDDGILPLEEAAPNDGPHVDELSNDRSINGQPLQKSEDAHKEYKYELKAMKWGLIPFWTKRSPDYGSMLRTINCRDDSLVENRGMWTTMKQKKRCIVICQGFYEWLKKGPGGKERVPYFVRRKDEQLMCFAGLWDCVKYEDSDEKLYTYTVITTDSNQQLSFLHDRMPVILDVGSEKMKTWLDPERSKWSKELQSILRPYKGELQCYPVNKAVGKAGNDSADFIVPIDSKENKSNIANFFGSHQSKPDPDGRHPNRPDDGSSDLKEKTKKLEARDAESLLATENNAPPPISLKQRQNALAKREHSPDQQAAVKSQKHEPSPKGSKNSAASPLRTQGRRGMSSGTPTKKAMTTKPGTGSQTITKFFGK